MNMSKNRCQRGLIGYEKLWAFIGHFLLMANSGIDRTPTLL